MLTLFAPSDRSSPKPQLNRSLSASAGGLALSGIGGGSGSSSASTLAPLTGASSRQDSSLPSVSRPSAPISKLGSSSSTPSRGRSVFHPLPPPRPPPFPPLHSHSPPPSPSPSSLHLQCLARDPPPPHRLGSSPGPRPRNSRISRPSVPHYNLRPRRRSTQRHLHTRRRL
jgi:hypothetical protein